MIDIDYYKTIAGYEGVTFEMKIALRDLITDVEREQSICEQKVDEACKKQREICAENLRQMCSPNNIGNERLIDIVLNAPLPKESDNE